MIKLKELRKNVDEIDCQILQLLLKRFEVTDEILEIKHTFGLLFRDRERERKIIESLVSKSSIDQDFLARLFQSIFDQAINRGRNNK